MPSGNSKFLKISKRFTQSVQEKEEFQTEQS